MPTNDERREVAARLRRYLSYAKKHDADENTDPCIHGNKMFRNIAQAIGGGISNITDTYEETLVKLIDLIEPEPERTCHFRNDGHGIMWCDAQGCDYEMDEYFPIPNYCPNCGAKVK